MSNIIYELFCKLNNIIALNVLFLDLQAVNICGMSLDIEASKCQLLW